MLESSALFSALATIDVSPGAAGDPLRAVLWQRASDEPLNVAALLVFACAVLHTLLAGRVRRWAESRFEHGSAAGRVWHFLGEVEVIFGLWVVVLAVAMAALKGWPAVAETSAVNEK